LQDDEQEQVSLSDLDQSPSSLADPEVNKMAWEDRFRELSQRHDTLKAEYDSLKTSNDTINILNDLMKPSANKAFRYMFAYSGFVGFVLIINGLGWFRVEFDPEVLKFLVGSTAATVLGLVGMVLTGIFVGARRHSGRFN